jgi:hypothetical protein
MGVHAPKRFCFSGRMGDHDLASLFCCYSTMTRPIRFRQESTTVQMHLGVAFLTIAFIWVFVSEQTTGFEGIVTFLQNNNGYWVILLFSLLLALRPVLSPTPGSPMPILLHLHMYQV